MRRSILFLSAMALVCGCALGTEILACISTPFPPAPVPCSTTPSTSCLFRNLLNTAVGSATLALDPNNNSLHVTGIGSSGNDGYEIQAGGSVVVDTNIVWDRSPCDANDTPTGAFMDVSAVGVFNGEPGKPVGSIRLTDIGSTLEISADFSAQGATTHKIMVLRHGQLVASITGHTGIVGTVFSWPIGVGKTAHTNPLDPNGCYTDDFPDGTTFIIAGGPTVVGDSLSILAENGGLVNAISSMRTRLKDIAGVRVTSETISMTPGIPTLSQWGLVALTTLLLVIGATLILGRVREGAA